MRSKPITKHIKIKKHKFKLEIYPSLVTWEYFLMTMMQLCTHLVINKN